MGNAGGHDFKMHMRKRDGTAACNTQQGFYEPLKVTSDPDAVTCEKCERNVLKREPRRKKVSA